MILEKLEEKYLLIEKEKIYLRMNLRKECMSLDSWFLNGKMGFHLVKDTTSKPTLTFAQPIQPEGWITRKGGMRPVEG